MAGNASLAWTGPGSCEYKIYGKRLLIFSGKSLKVEKIKKKNQKCRKPIIYVKPSLVPARKHFLKTRLPIRNFEVLITREIRFFLNN